MNSKKIFFLILKMIALPFIVFITWIILMICFYFYSNPKIIKGLEINGVDYTLRKNRFLNGKICKQDCYEVVYCFDKNNGICTEDIGHSPSGSLIQANKILNIYVKDDILRIVLPKNEIIKNASKKLKENNSIKFTIYDSNINAIIEYI